MFCAIAIMYIIMLFVSYVTPANVVRGNRKCANRILTGASGHELQTVDRISTSLLSRYFLISKREIGNWAMWFSIVFISIQV